MNTMEPFGIEDDCEITPPFFVKANLLTCMREISCEIDSGNGDKVDCLYDKKDGSRCLPVLTLLNGHLRSMSWLGMRVRQRNLLV